MLGRSVVGLSIKVGMSRSGSVQECSEVLSPFLM